MRMHSVPQTCPCLTLAVGVGSSCLVVFCSILSGAPAFPDLRRAKQRAFSIAVNNLSKVPFGVQYQAAERWSACAGQSFRSPPFSFLLYQVFHCYVD